MRYAETNNHGLLEKELSFHGVDEAILAYRGALFSGDVLLTARVERQMLRVFDENADLERNIYPEQTLYYMDRDAELILTGLRKQITPNNSRDPKKYVHADRAAQVKFILKEAGVSLQPESRQSSLETRLKQLIPHPRSAAPTEAVA